MQCALTQFHIVLCLCTPGALPQSPCPSDEPSKGAGCVAQAPRVALHDNNIPVSVGAQE